MLKMSKNKSAHNLYNKKNRTLTDYLQLFNTRNFFEEDNDIYYNAPNKGYKRLYNLNKIKKEKEEDYRQKMLKIREFNELSECSFAPKVNKDFEYKKDNIFNNFNINSNNTNNHNLFTDKSSSFGNKDKNEEITNIVISDLLKRQDEWIKKKNKKMEINKQLEVNKAKEKLIFFPEINKNNQKIFDLMKINSQEIVEDPESFKEYIERNKKFQKNFETNNYNLKEINKIRNSTNKNNYDYTEHKLINKHIFNVKNKSKESKSFDTKKQNRNKNKIYTRAKMNNINNNDIYNMIYLENKEKYEDRKNEGFSEKEKKYIFNGKTQMEFKEALDIIHHELINLDFFDESDNNESEENFHNNNK